MCGRFNLITDAQALADFLELTTTLELQPRYNIAPTQQIPVAREQEQGRTLDMLRWGLVPAWAKDEKTGYRMINARAETLSEKPAFRQAFRHRRCLIPATGFYEWKAGKAGKQPFHIRLNDGGLMAFAGIWEAWRDQAGRRLESCAIIVTVANDSVRPVHERMPVILGPADHPLWLSPEVSDPARLQPLLGPCPDEWLTLYPVSRRVNSPANDDPGCIAAVSHTPQQGEGERP